jgi:predicted alpha/beta-fold hydrolase
MEFYRPPGWLPSRPPWGGHVQTIWPQFFGQHQSMPMPPYVRERWLTPDGDFVDADWLEPDLPARNAPLLVLFHGLEGSSAGNYALAFADWARAHGWRFVVPHFRGCSGELNWGPRAYHSGDFEEIAWMLGQCRQRHGGPMVAVGISLGGNALMRWAQEAGAQAEQQLGAVAAISSPLDLWAGGRALGRGFNRWTYTPWFLRTMKPKALRKLDQHPGLFSRAALVAARDLYEFDNVFTAPLHGFKDTEDYWTRASAKPRLNEIQLPALLLNARDDPFVPEASLPTPRQVGECVTLWQPSHGGHVGFVEGAWPGHVLGLAARVMAWMCRQTGLQPNTLSREAHG